MERKRVKCWVWSVGGRFEVLDLEVGVGVE